jgi:general secretion pathway protein I
MTAGRQEAGFSLIESLVAMLILAIAAASLIRAAEAHIDSVRGMERRMAAALVAQNHLTELRLSGLLQPPRRAMVEMLGEPWVVTERRRTTADADLVAVRIEVRSRNERTPLATLDGFVDRNAGPE